MFHPSTKQTIPPMRDSRNTLVHKGQSIQKRQRAVTNALLTTKPHTSNVTQFSFYSPLISPACPGSYQSAAGQGTGPVASTAGEPAAHFLHNLCKLGAAGQTRHSPNAGAKAIAVPPCNIKQLKSTVCTGGGWAAPLPLQHTPHRAEK